MKSQLAMVVAAVCVFATVAFAPAANANWFGATGNTGACNVNGNITDNKQVVFDYVDPSDDLRNAANYTRNQLLNPTSLTTSLIADGGIHVDVEVGDRYYTDYCEAALGVQWTRDGVTGLRGMQTCERRVDGGNRCDRAVVRYSNYFFDAHGVPGDHYLVCHEIGHAIGLIHRDVAGCIRTGVDVSADEYTAHDIDHFNNDL